MSAYIDALRSKASSAGLKMSTDKFSGGLPVHDEGSRYSLVGGHGNGFTRAAGLALDEVGAAIDEIVAMDAERRAS